MVCLGIRHRDQQKVCWPSKPLPFRSIAAVILRLPWYVTYMWQMSGLPVSVKAGLVCHLTVIWGDFGD